MRDARAGARVRAPAVAGLFYPQDPELLRSLVRNKLLQAQGSVGVRCEQRQPVALIVPHAGYVYSGPIAGSAYSTLAGVQGIERVVIIGPSHFVPFRGLALPTAQALRTPLGLVPVDDEARREALRLTHVLSADAPHAREHSLEVQLPFLQVIFGEIPVLPIAAGEASAAEVAEVLERLWMGDGTLLVISSDLSHYLDYSRARVVDAATAEAILDYATDLDGDQACGCVGINGLMHAARRRELEVRLLDLRNSGDTQPDRSRVVGYGAFALYRAPAGDS
jgi:MEMO1 family protein